MTVVVLCLISFMVFSWDVQQVISSALISTNMELCGPESEIKLTRDGDTSAMVVTLSPTDNNNTTSCTLKVTAPKTHIINMHFIETSAEIQRVLIFNSSTENQQHHHHPPCPMSVFLPDNPDNPIWQGDPCSMDSLADIDLLTSYFQIVWTPPNHHQFTMNGRKIVVTAVGQGTVCRDSGQHTCMRIGWEPMLCISDHLLCDGISNCPRSSTTSDEDEKLCRNQLLTHSSWEQLVEMFKRLKPPADILSNNKWLSDKLEEAAAATSTTPKRAVLNWKEWQELKKLEHQRQQQLASATTQRASIRSEGDGNKLTDSISQVLSKYGPWGYLMLGMLICGTVLMFCGLWECCFRKQKSGSGTGLSSVVDGVTTMQQQQQLQSPLPTTVLIISSDDTLNNSSTNTLPPSYEDLDQPPSYITLFPNNSKQQPSSIIISTDNDNNSVLSNSSSDIISNNDLRRQTLVANVATT